MFERGGPKGVGGLDLPQEIKFKSFKFWCLKWPILTEMTVKYRKYFYFSCQQGGDIPPCGAEWGVRTPPPPPLAETLFYVKNLIL